MADSTEYPELYLQGIVHFNECDFFESHEVWEALWTDYQGPSRKFYQGLIQAAVALHHFGNGNIRGRAQALLQHAELSGTVSAVAPGARPGAIPGAVRAVLYRGDRQSG